MAKPYFETVKSFADVKVTEDGVDTEDFLQASDGLVHMFDLLGVGVFSFVQVDIKNNIHGVRTTFDTNKSERRTLELLVGSESGQHHKHGTGCLRRLLRGLLFTCRALQEARVHQEEDKMQPSFTRAYDSVLRHHHGRLVRSLVSVALRACPTRAEFFSRIAQGGDQTKLDEELGKWLEGLDVILARMTRFYAENEHGNV